MVQRKLAQDALTTRRKPYVDLAPVTVTSTALYQVSFFEATDEFHRAVVLDLQTLGKVNNPAAASAIGCLQGQQKLVLLRLDPRGASGLLAEVRKAADLITELRKRLVITLFQVMRKHGL